MTDMLWTPLSPHNPAEAFSFIFVGSHGFEREPNARPAINAWADDPFLWVRAFSLFNGGTTTDEKEVKPSKVIAVADRSGGAKTACRCTGLLSTSNSRDAHALQSGDRLPDSPWPWQEQGDRDDEMRRVLYGV